MESDSVLDQKVAALSESILNLIEKPEYVPPQVADSEDSRVGADADVQVEKKSQLELIQKSLQDLKSVSGEVIVQRPSGVDDFLQLMLKLMKHMISSKANS